ncbi:MAG TPA: hypothetical protein VHG72_21780 [Polyangia bacterium]|nr:hypothetical protein [Polyangia bacterium]
MSALGAEFASSVVCSPLRFRTSLLASRAPLRLVTSGPGAETPAVPAPPRNTTLFLFEQARPIIRLPKLRVNTGKRATRDGQRSATLTRNPLSKQERTCDSLLQWELATLGVYDSRPKRWRDCKPLPCPCCGAKVVMSVVPRSGEDEQDCFECPRCRAAVRFRDTASGPAWFLAGKSAAIPTTTPDNYPTYARALNHAGACPYFTCRHNLYSDVHPKTGSIKLTFPLVDPDRYLIDSFDPSKDSCSLRVSEQAGDIDDEATLDDIGQRVNLTEMRVLSLLKSGLKKVGGSDVVEEIRREGGMRG